MLKYPGNQRISGTYAGDYAMVKKALEVKEMTDGKVEVYEFNRRFFTMKDGDLFEITENGMVRLCDDATAEHEPVLVYRPRLWFATPEQPTNE